MFAQSSYFAHFLCEIQVRVCVTYDDAAKKYTTELTQTKFFNRKRTVSDQVSTIVEKPLTETPALYWQFGVSKLTFLISTSIRNRNKEDVFSKEPF